MKVGCGGDFLRGRRATEEGGAGLCNQYVHWDNSYLVFNQKGAHSNVLTQLRTTITKDFSTAFHQLYLGAHPT